MIYLFKDKKFNAIPKGPDGHAQDFVIFNDGSQPELGSVLL